PGGHRALLPRLRGTDGALRRSAARSHPPGDLRAHGRGYGSRGASAARSLRAAVRGILPALLRECAAGAHRQLGTGTPADLPGRGGSLAALRALAGAAEVGPGAGVGESSRRARSGVSAAVSAGLS